MKKKIVEDNTNIGVQILRMLLCFLVILSFNWGVGINDSELMSWVNFLELLPIPTFMALSFVFSEGYIRNSNGKKLSQRIVRLIIPLVGWALIYWIFYKLMEELLYPGYEIRIKDLFLQIFTGNSFYLNSAMWFQVALILITLLLALIALLIDKFHTEVFGLLAIAALVVQYLGLFSFVDNYRGEVQGLLGRIPEMLPLAVMGYLFVYYGLMRTSKKHWISSIIIGVGILCFLKYCSVFEPIEGYGYAGLLYVFGAAALILIFYALPLDNLPKVLKAIIKKITDYTLGIYCVSHLVETLWHYFVSHRQMSLETYTFKDSVIIYVISYAVCFLISLIPGKWAKMMVK